MDYKKIWLASSLIIVGFCSRYADAGCVLYKGQYGSEAVAHVDGEVVYKGQDGCDPGDAIAHVDSGVVYKGQYGYDAIAHVDGGVIYKGQYGYDVIAHVEGCSISDAAAAAAGAAFILGLL